MTDRLVAIAREQAHALRPRMHRLRASVALAVLLSLCFAADARTDAGATVTGHPPDATAERPSISAPTTATLRGTVGSHDDPTTYHFEYGTTLAYGARTPTRHVAAGAPRVEEPLRALVPGARYNVRLVATNAAGTTRSGERRFVAGAVSASTAAADPVEATAATLRGKVEPHGSATTVRFAWGPTTRYGSSTPDVSVAAGFDPEPVSARLTGLVAGRRYHYRVVATNAHGTITRGDSQSFVAGGPSAGDAHVAVTSAGTASATATVDSHGLATAYRFEYGTSSWALDSSTTAQHLDVSDAAPKQVTAELSGLTPGETYFVRVTAENDAATDDGRLTSFVAGRASARLHDPTRLAATAATVSGVVNPSGQPATHYFEYGPTSAYGFRTADVSAGSGIAPQDVSARLTDLTPGAEYHVRLVATNASGVTATPEATFTPSGTAVVRESGADTTSPTAATVFGTLDGRGTETAYWFEYGPTPDLGSRTPTHTLAADAGETGVAADAGGLTAGELYYYRLVAANAAGPVAGAGERFVVRPAPTAATLGVDDLTSTGASVRGELDSHGSPAVYRFEYAAQERFGAGGTYTSRTAAVTVGERVGREAVDATLTDLRPGTTYHVRLVAASSAGRSAGADRTFTTRSGSAAPVILAPEPVHRPAGPALQPSDVPPGTADPSGEPAPEAEEPFRRHPVIPRDPLAPTWLVNGKPVAAPKAPRVRSLPGEVRLALAPLRARGVAGYRIYRRIAGSSETARLVRSVKRPKVIFDHTVTPRVRYEYLVVAVTTGGRASMPSAPARVRVRDPR